MPQLLETLSASAKAHPEDPTAVLRHPETQKFLKLAEATAKTHQDKPILHALEVVEENIALRTEGMERALRGDPTTDGAQWKRLLRMDPRRKSTITTALGLMLLRRRYRGIALARY
ncbi:MAG: hypothetical protein K2Q01_01210 [Rickettsiales bacterium]|nr:hypothetical protein [Rickettsiales bacterium]